LEGGRGVIPWLNGQWRGYDKIQNPTYRFYL
jgi:hypothetical protein